MASNSFGNLFKIVTWGESHGKAIGVVVDGCPAGLALSENDINAELFWRMPGRNAFTSPRQEKDRIEILSGVFEGVTTGAPISLVIWNLDAQSQSYESMQSLLRPGHANYSYLQKYGCFDHRGGGRASARETACRVAAGAIAKKILAASGMAVIAFLRSAGAVIGDFELSDVSEDVKVLQERIRESSVFCPDYKTAQQIESAIDLVKKERDSIGGIVEAVAFNVPVGLGDPVYEKLEANLAKAMLSIPASKGFEIGSGFGASSMKGSEHNDRFCIENQKITLASNHAGGTLGGISNGMPIVVRVPFKPTSTIGQDQQTVSITGELKNLKLPDGSRHDPCVAIRAIPVVEAMFALVLVDAMLMNRSIRLVS